MLNAEVSIITPTELYVKQMEARCEIKRNQVRTIHDQIEPSEIKPEMRDLGYYIARCQKKGERVRVPALLGNEWGHFLRTLELTRDYM